MSSLRCINPWNLPTGQGDEYIKLPCGHCVACRKRSAQEWCMRLKQEYKVAKTAYFITLTYDEENVPYRDYVQTLNKPDLQKFWKRLRTRQKREFPEWEEKIRYYAVGEYGSKTLRPHYHAMVFGMHPMIRGRFKKIWTHGRFLIETFTEGRTMYITDYQQKKGHYPKDAEKPFTCISTKPAIGYAYIEKFKKWHLEGNKLYMQDGMYKRPLPRYYRSKIFGDVDLQEEKDLIELSVYEAQKKTFEILKKRGIEDPKSYLREQQEHRQEQYLRKINNRKL